MKQLIKFNGKYVPVLITPHELEGSTAKTFFKRNPIGVINLLCKMYKIKPKYQRSREGPLKRIRLILTELDIDLTAYGQSNRKAMKRMAFKLHYEYTNKIVEIPQVEPN